MNRKVVVLSGVSGSGKSTAARKLWNELEPGTYCKVVSADDYFMVDGEYQFDVSKLSDAHGACFRSFIHAISPGVSDYHLVVVDNTNTTAVEIAPYILGAQAYGWEAEIITILPALPTTSPAILNWREDYAQKCAARNKHGVGYETIRAQLNRIMTRELMPWWKQSTVEGA